MEDNTCFCYINSKKIEKDKIQATQMGNVVIEEPKKPIVGTIPPVRILL
jgi:hypothetical protein